MKRFLFHQEFFSRGGLLIGAMIVAFFFVGTYVVQSQGPPPTTTPTITGKTRTVALIPFGSVNAGPFTFSFDTDHDGLPDDYELQNGFNPNDPNDADGDPDGDGLTNGDEYTLGTNPRVADTDGDGFSDGVEVQQGYNPLDPNSHPPAGGPTVVSLQVTPNKLGLSLNSLIPASPVPLTVTGVLSDGTTVDLTHNSATSYQSVNPAIAAVDSFGKVVPVATGATAIKVRNASLSTDALVTVLAFTPRPVGFIPLPGFANNVDVSGHEAYVACGLAGLQVVDATNPAVPQLVGTLDLPGNANDIRVVGTLAYLAAGNGGLQIADISDPQAPVLVGGVAFAGAVDVVVDGHYAYVAAGTGGLKIVDVSVPFAPAVVASVTLPANRVAQGVAVDATRKLAVVVASEGINGWAYTINLATPTAPQIRAELFLLGATGVTPTDVALNGTVAYVTSSCTCLGTGGIPSAVTILDVANPDTPFVRGQANRPFSAADVEVHNQIAFLADNALFGTLLFSVANPSQMSYLGGFPLSSPPLGTGIAVTDSLVFVTASRTQAKPGVSGDTGLHLLQYTQTDLSSLPPTATITSPTNGLQLVVGESIPVRVAATDDQAVFGVEIKANGTIIGFPNQPPYQVTYTVPASAAGSSVRFEARAVDAAANSGDATPVTVQVLATDPLTTVVGQVVTLDAVAVSGATVTLDGTSRTTITDAQGNFSFPGVATVPLGVRVSASINDPVNGYRGRSASAVTVRGGLTNLGTIPLAVSGITPLPTILSAVGVGDYAGGEAEDLFIGFSDRPSQVYVSEGTGQFTPSSTYVLPFSSVRSGTGIDLNQNSKVDVGCFCITPRKGTFQKLEPNLKGSDKNGALPQAIWLQSVTGL